MIINANATALVGPIRFDRNDRCLTHDGRIACARTSRLPPRRPHSSNLRLMSCAFFGVDLFGLDELYTEEEDGDMGGGDNGRGTDDGESDVRESA